MDKRPKTIKEMFDQIAPRYDLLNHILSLSVDTLWRRKAIRRLGIKRGDSILDIATGTGDLLMLALKRKRDCRVVGIDLSSEMLRIVSQKKDRKSHRRRYSLVAGDACSMPFRGYAFDHAMVAFGIRNMSEVEYLFKEVRRILKDGGRFAILEFSIPEVHFIRKIYLFYLKKIVPLIGRLLSGRTGPYDYLRNSIMTFYKPEEIKEMLRGNSFEIVESLPLWFGICHLYIAEAV